VKCFFRETPNLDFEIKRTKTDYLSWSKQKATINNNYQIKKIKSLLYSLNTLSGVTIEWCPSPRLCAKAHTIKVATVTSRWQRMGDLIGSGFEPHSSRTRSERLTSGRYAGNIQGVRQKDLTHLKHKKSHQN